MFIFGKLSPANLLSRSALYTLTLLVSSLGMNVAHSKTIQTFPSGSPDAPKDPTRFVWASPDGTLFPAREWLPPAGRNPRAICVAIHGLSGAAEDFEPLSEFFPQMGIVLLAPNLRSQGNDPVQNRRGNLGDFHALLRDINAFIAEAKERWPGLPVILYGESMGAMLLVHREALAGANAADALILASPVVDLKGELSPIQKTVFLSAGTLLPWLRLDFGRMGTQTAINTTGAPPRMTRDLVYEERLKNSPHKVSQMTLRFLKPLSTWILNSKKFAPSVKTPVLVMAAGNDVFISPQQVTAFCEKLGSADKELVVFPESYHLLLHDLDRPEVEQLIKTWLRKRVPSL